MSTTISTNLGLNNLNIGPSKVTSWPECLEINKGKDCKPPIPKGKRISRISWPGIGPPWWPYAATTGYVVLPN